MKFKLGTVLIILTFLVSLNPYTLIFVIPVFIIGCLLLWLGEGALTKKIIYTVAPIILWYPGFLGFMYLNSYLGHKFAQKIEFKIPKNFRGQITVVYPVECGQEILIENNREIIEVTEDGIVYYQGEIESGYMNWTYKLQSSDKNVPLFEFKTGSMTPKDRAIIKADSLGIFLGGGWSVSSTTSEPGINYKVRTLFVGEWKYKGREFSENFQDSLRQIYEEKIRECKKAYNMY